MLTATIAGFPPAMNAMSTLRTVLAERSRECGAGSVSRLHSQRGGVLAKTLVLLLIVLLAGAAVVYVYGKRQQPLSIEDATVRATDGGSGTMVLAPDGRIYVATIVHNDGTFPITLLGLDDAPPPHDQPYAATSVGLGDGEHRESRIRRLLHLRIPEAGRRRRRMFVVYEPNPGLRVRAIRRRGRATRRPSHRCPFDSAPTGWRRSRRWRSRAPRRSRGSRARSASARLGA